MDKTKWNKITKKQMPMGKDVLVLLEDGKMQIGYRRHKYTLVGGRFGFDCSPIAYWMKLPDKPYFALN